MQTILGSGGAIGTQLAKALTEYTTDIRLVSRNPEKINETDELFPTDLLDKEQLKQAISGSGVAYITVGFPYKYKVWEQTWPPFIRNVIDICNEEKCKLVFFDNIYMYDKNHLSPMDEDTPINPPSKKGQVRAKIAKMIMDEVQSGELTALIARCADYYGPSIEGTSLLTETVFKPLSNGKKANWLASDKYKHSFTYTPDAGKAVAMLGNSEKAYGEVWHMPTAKKPPTGREWVELVAKKMGKEPKLQVAPEFLVKIMGMFNSIMKESVEMMYQYDRDYIFDSSKFEKEFDFKPTPYEKGVEEIIKKDYS